jgi:hypothetical protein
MVFLVLSYSRYSLNLPLFLKNTLANEKTDFLAEPAVEFVQPIPLRHTGTILFAGFRLCVNYSDPFFPHSLAVGSNPHLANIFS